MKGVPDHFTDSSKVALVRFLGFVDIADACKIAGKQGTINGEQQCAPGDMQH